MTQKEIKELSKRLKTDIRFMKAADESMNSASWKYEEGILISGKEAEYLVQLIKLQFK